MNVFRVTNRNSTGPKAHKGDRMRKYFLMFVITGVASTQGNMVFAQTAGTSEVPEDITVDVVGAGPDEVVEVPYLVEKEVELDNSNITNVTQEGNSFLVRSGVGVRTFQTNASAVLAKLIELDGEVGYGDSPWRVSGAIGAGPGGNGTVAIGGNLVLAYLFQPKLRLGIGTDVMYFTDVTDVRPKEASKLRYIGGAARFGVAIGRLQLEAYLGLAVSSIPVVGGIDNHFGGYGGVSAAVLF